MAQVDTIGPWSREKLELLREYLAAYTSILRAPKNQRWCRACHYVDAFAGSVRPLAKEDYQFVDGSPLLALKNNPPFDSFTFIDKDAARIRECVEPLRKEFPLAASRMETHIGDCNDILLDTVLPRFSGRSCPERGFIFLDPYGTELSWETVSAVGKSEVYDILVNFSVMGIYRQLGTRPPTAANRDRINRMMGDESWFAEAYQPSRQLMLLESMAVPLERQGEKLAERLVELYRQRLTKSFGHVSRAVIMRNSNGGPLYALILASHARVAVDKMHEIFDRRARKKPPAA